MKSKWGQENINEVSEFILVKTIGKYGIYLFKLLDNYNVINMQNKKVMSRVNIISVEDAEKYVEELIQRETE